MEGGIMKKTHYTQAKAENNRNNFEKKAKVMGSPVRKVPGVKSIKSMFGF